MKRIPSAEEVDQIMTLLQQYAHTGELSAAHSLDCKQCWLADENKGKYCPRGEALWTLLIQIETQVVDMLPKIKTWAFFDEADLAGLEQMLARFQKTRR